MEWLLFTNRGLQQVITCAIMRYQFKKTFQESGLNKLVKKSLRY